MQRSLSFICAATIVLSGCRAASGTVPLQPPVNPSSQSTTASVSQPRHGALLVVNPKKTGAVVSSLVLGANMATWYNITQPGLATAFKTAGMTATRWPGGSLSDVFHWQANSLGQGACDGSYVNPSDSFDAFVADIAHTANLNVAITVNYGSDPTCTTGASPSEAAGWVAYANATKRYGVKWWTVGNEEFGNWETDLNSQPHSPSQYATNVATQFYPQMKAASPTPINVCVNVEPGWYTGWDPVVLSQAKYDCVELHYYPQGDTVSDSYIIDQGAAGLTTVINQLKTELSAAGHAGTPIYVGEIGSTYATPGKQTMSITQALYAGQVIGEMLDDGVARATWWLGYGGCNSSSGSGDFSSSLYGWQNFGGFMIFSDGTLEDGCSTTNVPTGTLLPTARAFEVASHFVRQGEHMLGVTADSLPNVRAYATTYDGGYALMLFNVNETSAVSVPVKISGKSSGTGGNVYVYDKAIYDKSRHNVWKGPVHSKLSAWTGSFSVNLPPWSMTVVQTH